MNNFLRTQLPLMVLSLIIAFIFWLVVSGRDMSPHELVANLVLGEPPSRLYVDTTELPSAITINVEANTAQFRLMEGRKPSLNISLDNIIKGPNTIVLDANTMLTPPLPRGIQNVKVIPSEITVIAYSWVTREVPVNPPFQGTLPPYLEINGEVSINPSRSRITAPENRAGSINALNTTPINLSEIKNDDNITRLTPSTPGYGTWLKVDPEVFYAHVPVVVKTGVKTLPIPLHVTGQPLMGPPLPVVIHPLEANVTVNWRQDRSTEPSSESITLTLNLDSSELDRKNPTRVPIHVTSLPQGVTISSITPQEVTVTWLTAQNYRRLLANQRARNSQENQNK